MKRVSKIVLCCLSLVSLTSCVNGQFTKVHLLSKNKCYKLISNDMYIRNKNQRVIKIEDGTDIVEMIISIKEIVLLKDDSKCPYCDK